MIIKINIANKRAAAEKDPLTGALPVIVCGNTDYQIKFAFDEEWDSFTAKTAVFIWRQGGQLQTCEAPFNGDTVSVPMLQKTFKVFVGVYAGELHTTTSAQIECEYSALCDAEGATKVYPTELTKVLLCIAQELTEEEQAQVRENIGVDLSNYYDREFLDPVIISADERITALEETAVQSIADFEAIVPPLVERVETIAQDAVRVIFDFEERITALENMPIYEGEVEDV